MTKPGPDSRLQETRTAIKQVLLKESDLSAREIRKRIKDHVRPSSYTKILEALDQLLKFDEISVKEIKSGRGIPKKVYQLKGKGVEDAEKSQLVSWFESLSREEMEKTVGARNRELKILQAIQEGRKSITARELLEVYRDPFGKDMEGKSWLNKKVSQQSKNKQKKV